MLERYVKKILSSRVYDVAVETPLQPAPRLSSRTGHRVLLKREDMQPVFSFKIRGAYNKIAQLSAEEQARGVIAASAGNHAQGVALAAQRLGLKATIVMGRNTPSIKVNAVRERGARVVLHGDGFDEAKAHADELVEKHGFTFVHPFDDVDVIAGQGTVGMEIMNQHARSPDAIFVPVGGGGLVAGISALRQVPVSRTRRSSAWSRRAPPASRRPCAPAGGSGFPTRAWICSRTACPWRRSAARRSRWRAVVSTG